MTLKKPTELAKLSTDELFNYIDELHRALKSYQLIVDSAVSKNKNIQ